MREELFINPFANLFMASQEQLLAVLLREGVTTAGVLAARLDISQPTLSRLVRAAGDAVCQLGRGRATRYALSRSLAAVGSQLPISRVEETGAVVPHGVLHLLADDRHWLELHDGTGTLFQGLPPFARDMSPQGFLGRHFPALYPELGLPRRLSDWNDDDCLVALARRGEDCSGNLIVGKKSLDRFFAATSAEVSRDEYPVLARAALLGQPGSSAAGEQPKFAAYVESRHVLVKFAGKGRGAAERRWRDLLECERIALEMIAESGIAAANASCHDIQGGRYLEVERFDRVGKRGRRGLVSLFAVAVEYLGYLDGWTRAATDLLDEGFINTADACSMRWLDVFGDLIGNTDRHFGNLAFYPDDDGRLRLAPVYDMLPMLLAPQGTEVVERLFAPQPPNADNYDVWPDAARVALAYWQRLNATTTLSREFRRLCSSNAVLVEAFAAPYGTA